jgi:integrase
VTSVLGIDLKRTGGVFVESQFFDKLLPAFCEEQWRHLEGGVDAPVNWFNEQEWEPGTFNRYRTVLSGIYRLGMENGKISSNPARLLKRKRESDGRVRFLNQFPPADTEVDSLKPHKDEESRLRAIVAAEYPQHMDELDVALNTGMRRSEQYTRIDWSCVDLERKNLTIPKSKIGQSRHIPLNAAACAAFTRLLKRSIGEGPILIAKGSQRLLGPRHWFEDAVQKAGLKVPLTWHDLRHTFASRLVMAGVDIRTVAELMGHKRIQMTMRYAHLAPAHKLDAVERLGVYNSSGPASGSEPAVTAGPTDTARACGISVGPETVN